MKSGRPPKFAGPRHPITVTLPEDTLARLASVDSDRARAIVKVTAVAMSADPNRQKQVELQEVSPGLAIIIVGPSRLLRRIEWLRLVQVAPMRFLLSIPVGTSVSALELAILELLDEESSDHEHSLLIELRDLIRSRRHGGLSKGELLFIDTQVTAEGTGANQKSRKASKARR